MEQKMNYQEMARQAIKKGTGKPLTINYRKMEKSGDVLIGMYLTKVPVEGKLNTGTYYQYTFQTDSGYEKIAPGGVFDGEQGAMLIPGNVYQLTFRGKEAIQGGARSVNKWELLCIQENVQIEEAAFGAIEHPLESE